MSTSLLVSPSPYAPDKVKEDLGDRIRSEKRDFERLSQGLYHVDEDGRLIRDGHVADGVYFRQIRDDADILETLRINSSLFGSSKKYSEEELVSHRRQWLEKNRDCYRVLEVHNRIVGFINAFPFSDEIITRILAGEIKLGDLPLQELREYIPGPEHKTNAYLQTVGIHKEFQAQTKRMYGWYMISGFCSLINNLGRRGVEIGSLYTRSDELDGINLSFGLGLKEYPVSGVKKLVFRLDFSEPNVFLRDYQNNLQEYKTASPLKNTSI